MIAENIHTVEERILAACKRSGRSRKEITLIAVSKTMPVSLIEEAIATGITQFGENRIQELCEKIEQLTEPLHWHMIGHLQRNKVKYIIGKTELIHSVDSFRLAEQLQEEASKLNTICDILLEVNMSGETSKFGLAPKDVLDLVKKISHFTNVRLRGLMTVAPFTNIPEENRYVFHNMQQLSVDIAEKNIDNVCMDLLSMGMTGDYEVAIEEGATHIRVGTGIFGVR